MISDDVASVRLRDNLKFNMCSATTYAASGHTKLNIQFAVNRARGGTTRLVHPPAKMRGMKGAAGSEIYQKKNKICLFGFLHPV